MKKQLLLFVGLILLISNYSVAQDLELTKNLSQIRDLKLMVEVILKAKDSKKTAIDGSSYLNKDWAKGYIKIIGKGEFKIDSLNYDLYTNTVLFKSNGQTYSISNNNIEYFVSDSAKFINTFNKNFSQPYLEVLCNGKKLKLFKLFECVIIPGSPNKGVFSEKNDEYRIESKFYTNYDNNNISKFNPTKKNLYKLMDDKKETIEKYIKDNKIKVRNQENLINVFNYYDSLN